MPTAITPLPLDGLFLLEPQVFEDSRGFFMETYRASELSERGLNADFVQDNHSYSRKGVLRGLHFQREPHAQVKLIRVIAGAAWDVAVDIRTGSPSFGRWYGLELSAANRRILYIPKGFAHGFLAIADGTEPHPSLAEGLHLQRVLEAMRESAERREWVALPQKK